MPPASAGSRIVRLATGNAGLQSLIEHCGWQTTAVWTRGKERGDPVVMVVLALADTSPAWCREAVCFVVASIP